MLRYVFEQLAIQDTRKMESPETVKPRALTAESDDRRKDRLRRRKECKNVRGNVVLRIKRLNEGRYD